MKLYTRCSKCRHEINFSARVSDRFGLAAKMGEKVELKCTSCNTLGKYHVNDIKAEKSKKVALIATVVLLGGTASILAYLWDYLFQIADVYAISSLGGVVGIPMLFYLAITSEQEKKVWIFNAYWY